MNKRKAILILLIVLITLLTIYELVPKFDFDSEFEIKLPQNLVLIHSHKDKDKTFAFLIEREQNKNISILHLYLKNTGAKTLGFYDTGLIEIYNKNNEKVSFKTDVKKFIAPFESVKSMKLIFEKGSEIENGIRFKVKAAEGDLPVSLPMDLYLRI